MLWDLIGKQVDYMKEQMHLSKWRNEHFMKESLLTPKKLKLNGSMMTLQDLLGEGEVVQSCPTLCNPWTVGYQASPFMGFSRQEYWSGLPFPCPGDLPNPGIRLGCPALEADTLTSAPPLMQKKKKVLSIIGDCNAKVGSREIAEVTGKFSLAVQNETEQRLTEFCQESNWS